MIIERLSHDPSALIDFYEEGLQRLGAVCHRSWHDQLEVLAEGPAAKLWGMDSTFIERHLFFPPGDQAPSADGALSTVFPGCPLTFRLAEALRAGMSIFRTQLQAEKAPPSIAVVEKLWQAQFPGRVQIGPLKPVWYFSALALVRCDIQAIDQRWSLHRIAISLTSGRRDSTLETDLPFLEIERAPEQEIVWPEPSAFWMDWVRAALLDDLESELSSIRRRQELYLARELNRIDDYFESYVKELRQRAIPAGKKEKFNQREEAAISEHQRRRQDQVERHKIHIVPHLDCVSLFAERAWQADVITGHRNLLQQPAILIPRSRQWMPL